MSLGPVIRRYRGDRSQVDLARQMHISRERISQMERDEILWPGPEVFNALSRSLEVPVEVFLSAAGVGFDSVMYQLGHSTPTMTMLYGQEGRKARAHAEIRKVTRLG